MTRLNNEEEGEYPSSAIPKINSASMMRQVFYRLFSSLFQYPDEELLSELQGAIHEMISLQDEWEQNDFSEKLMSLFEDILEINLDDRKLVVDEYNRLFLVKPKVSPYETSYVKLPGQSEGMIAAEISGIYRLAGLTVSPDMNELPDHISVELEFMSFLCEKELKALLDESQDAIASAQREQQVFFSMHLARWFPQFVRKALEEADEKLLYHKVVGTAFAFMRHELELLEIKMAG